MVNSNHFLIKLSGGKRGVNLNLISDWFMRDDGFLFVSFGVPDSEVVYSGDDAQQLLRLLHALSIDLETFDRNQLAAEALRAKWVNEKLEKANINNIKQEAQ